MTCLSIIDARAYLGASDSEVSELIHGDHLDLRTLDGEQVTPRDFNPELHRISEWSLAEVEQSPNWRRWLLPQPEPFNYDAGHAPTLLGPRREVHREVDPTEQA